MSRLLSILVAFALLLGVAPVQAQSASEQDLSGLARVDMNESAVTQRGDDVMLRLGLSQPVPYRIYTLTAPPRLVIDFREVDWRGLTPDQIMGHEAFKSLNFGGFRPGWSRLVAALKEPLELVSAEMPRDPETGAAVLDVVLAETDPARFVARSGAPSSADWPEPSITRKPAREGDVLIMLDPGHGGIDPGAARAGVIEKELVLTFARELAEALRRLEGINVVLTREADVFVSLERRVAMAHQAGADLFISLHADALSEGHAHGATVHTLAEEASDTASALLVERHDRADMLAGIDLSGQDDEIADVLLDLARRETQPRAERLAKALIGGIESIGAPVNRRPHRSAAFSVLKAADIPSVLLEIGFMSSDRDFENITDPAWRRTLAEGLRDGIQAWMIEDESLGGLVRQ